MLLTYKLKHFQPEHFQVTFAAQKHSTAITKLFSRSLEISDKKIYINWNVSHV